MEDYIPRKEAIIAVCRARLPDTTDDGIPIANGKRSVSDCVRRIKEIPSANVRKVVLCGDCIHLNKSESNMNGFYRCDRYDAWQDIGDRVHMPLDGFCSYGDRGTNNEKAEKALEGDGMKEYIEKEALKNAIYADGNLTAYLDYIINRIPAADVRPVVRGKWNRTDAYPHRLYCSVCYKTYLKNDELLERWEFPLNFCPNCGADMREETE